MLNKLPGPFLKATGNFGIHVHQPNTFLSLSGWRSVYMLRSGLWHRNTVPVSPHKIQFISLHYGSYSALAHTQRFQLSSENKSGLKTNTGYCWVCGWDSSAETSIAFHCTVFLPRPLCLIRAVRNCHDRSVQRGYLWAVPHKPNKCGPCLIFRVLVREYELPKSLNLLISSSIPKNPLNRCSLIVVCIL